MDFMKTDPVAWERFGRETHADGRCWTIPAGARAFAMSRMWDPSPVECIRVEGETECGWGLAVVILTIKQNEKRAEAEKRDAEAANAKAPKATGRR
ncbi:hypothetical protein NS228_10110 [Methylobacterium indicum]|uniref:hypothetical protein n=1 Tax=Methylobacterium indicum TaxID=1775910 RepID=UPI000733D43B|nr:hypothetical protein [Methylobacterium indicum]KTS30820.1 hypothetical protein NS229_14975 [Methylobacterium indicum]KTS40635.1 hypothetical protein NS228_10110 [Methylobacterium indicum]KTS44994.1 hypothetical protein NS230_24525 [Methylobacterium indicum]